MKRCSAFTLRFKEPQTVHKFYRLFVLKTVKELRRQNQYRDSHGNSNTVYTSKSRIGPPQVKPGGPWYDFPLKTQQACQQALLKIPS